MKIILTTLLVIFSLFLISVGYSLISPPANTTFGLENEIEKIDFQSLSGSRVKIGDFGASPKILVSWVTYNSYCEDELEILSRIADGYGDRLKVVAISSGERDQVVEAFLRENSISSNIAILLDEDEKFHQTIIGRIYPELIFIDSSGRITTHERGFLDESQIRRRAEAIVSNI